MASYAIWIDTEHAKVFKFIAGEKTHVDQKELKRHGHHHGQDHKDEEKFYHEVSGVVKDANELLIVGPGVGKTHFHNHLTKHNHANLAKAIVGVESMDHMTDGQILAAARKFFKKWDVMHTNV